MKKQFEIVVDEKWCKGCALCVHYCPAEILFIADDFKVHISDESKCLGCSICEYRCPDFAISVNEIKEKVKI